QRTRVRELKDSESVNNENRKNNITPCRDYQLVEVVQTRGGDTPDHQIGEFGDLDVRVFGVFGLEDDTVGCHAESLDGHFSVNYCHDHVAVAEFDGPVHDQFIAVKNTGALHRVTGNPHNERGQLVADQHLG